MDADWISESELAAATGVAAEDRPRFHRNLVNWRHHGSLPEYYDGRVVPQVLPLEPGPGNEAWYPPVTLAMVRRINELRDQFPKNMDEWLWQLWLERYPVDIVKWCRRRLLKLTDAVSDTDEKTAVGAATRKPVKRSDYRHAFYRPLKVRGWFALMTWSTNIVIGARAPHSMFDPKSAPLAALATLLGLAKAVSAVRDALAGSPIEDLSIARLLTVLDEADATALEKLRVDCWALAHGRRKDLFGRVLSLSWRNMYMRAGLVPALIALRRSPDHQESLAPYLGVWEPAP